MITPIQKIAAEVVRQAAQHTGDTTAQTYQRVADELHIDVALVAEAMRRYTEGQPASQTQTFRETEPFTGDASDGCGESHAGKAGEQ